MGMDGGGRSSGGAKESKSKRDPRKAKEIMNMRRRISLFLTRLKKLIKTREKERLAKEAREQEERLAEEAREKARQEERLAKEAREQEERLAEEAREKARQEERLAKEAREKEERLAEEAREKARQEERLAKEAREKEERLAELTEGIRKAAASSYALWVQDAEEEDDPNETESTKEFLRQIREGEMTEEIFIQRGLKDALEGKMVIEGDFEEDDKWPPSPSESP